MAEKVKYLFNGQTYTIKGRLCHDIVKYYVEQNPNATLAALQKAFNTATHMIVATPEMALTVFTSDGKAGGDYYMKDEDQIAIKNGKIVVWSYWPESYFKPFMEQVKALGYEVTESGAETIQSSPKAAAPKKEANPVKEEKLDNEEFVVPYGTTVIKRGMVKDGIKTAVIPDTVVVIDYGAFSNQYNLTSVVIPNSVLMIRDYAFRECNNLTSIVIPDSVEMIGEGAFDNCQNLVSIDYPNEALVGRDAFGGCPGCPVDKSIDKIKRSMEANGLSAFYLFSNDWYPTIEDVLDDVLNELSEEERENYDIEDAYELFDWGQGDFGMSYSERYDTRVCCSETCYIREIRLDGDNLLFNIEEVYENSNGGYCTLSYWDGQTIDDLLRYTPNQSKYYNVKRIIENIANDYIDNPVLVAASKVVDFNPEDYCEFD